MRGFMCNINNEACEDFSWDRCGMQVQGRKLTLCRLKLVFLQSYTKKHIFEILTSHLESFCRKKGFTLQVWVHSCVSKFRRYWLQPGSLLGSLFRIGVGGLSLWSLHSAFWNRPQYRREVQKIIRNLLEEHWNLSFSLAAGLRDGAGDEDKAWWSNISGLWKFMVFPQLEVNCKK